MALPPDEALPAQVFLPLLARGCGPGLSLAPPVYGSHSFSVSE